MSALHTVPKIPNHLSHPLDPQHQTSKCKALFLDAQYEMAAFVTAVRSTRGEQAVQQAGRYWLEELNRLKLQPGSLQDWRAVSIHAASRMASVKKPCAIFRWPCSHSASSSNSNATDHSESTNPGLAIKLHRGIDSVFIWAEALAVYATKDLILLLLSL
jgi:hypothetical protein